MVSVRDRLGVAVRAKSNKNRVRGNGPVTASCKTNGLAKIRTKPAQKNSGISWKTGLGGVSCDGYHPQHVSRHNRSHAQSD